MIKFTNRKNIYWHLKQSQLKSVCIYIVKDVQVVTYVERSHFSCPVIENFLGIEPLLRDHLSKKTLFLCPKDDLLIQVWLYLVTIAVQTSKTNQTEIGLYLYLVMIFVYFYFCQMWHLPRNVRCRNREPSERIYTISRNIK